MGYDRLIDLSLSKKDLTAGLTRFRRKPVVIHAKKMESSFEISSTNYSSGYSGEPSDWLIITDKEVFSCSGADFFDFYEEIEPESDPEEEPKKIERISITKNDMISGVSIFRKRPLQVSAKKINFHFSLETKMGILTGCPGDWVTEEYNGELSLCRDEIFQDIYRYEQPKENSDKEP